VLNARIVLQEKAQAGVALLAIPEHLAVGRPLASFLVVQKL